MKHSGEAVIVRKTIVSEKIFSIELDCPEIAEKAGPGQFVQVKIPGIQTVLWPRPFSIHDAYEGRIVLFIKKYGRITESLASLPLPQKLFVTGPLGNGFRLSSGLKEIFLVAGGVGLPPLHFLCKKLLADGTRPSAVHFYSGAKSKAELFAHEAITDLGVNYHAATEDGSAGFKGLVTQLLEPDLRGKSGLCICACGPPAMMKAVADLAAGAGHHCLLSLEQLMPCGWGVCNGCAIKIKKTGSEPTEDERGFRLARVCKEGPVFESGMIEWNQI